MGKQESFGDETEAVVSEILEADVLVKIGTMIEFPRARAVAGEIAAEADFFPSAPTT